MPARSLSVATKSAEKRKGSTSPKKERETVPDEEIIDPRQEQIDGLLREQEKIRSKLNLLCSRIIESVNIEDYARDVDLSKQQPSDIALEHLLSMVDELGYFRSAFLNLVQETDDEQKLPVQSKITQLSVEESKLFRTFLTSDQRLTFVARERDIWKENAQFLQMLYATIVDQLEIGVFQKLTPNASEILQAHRLNLEDACRIFLSPSIRSLNERHSKRVSVSTEAQATPVEVDVGNQPEAVEPTNSNESVEQASASPAKSNRRVSFAEKVNIIAIDTPVAPEDQSDGKPTLPSAGDTLVENMDSNLRMLIIKELSKDSHIQKPLSKRSSVYRTKGEPDQPQTRSQKWMEFARLVGINESEIEHWFSQSLQYPAGRVISTWCNCRSSPPTVAELYKIISSNRLDRLDLARAIETLYRI